MLLAWGRSHRTTTDGEIIRWGTDLARVEGIGRARHDRGGDRPRRGDRARPAASGSGSTGWAVARPDWPACCGSSSSRPRRCCSSPARRRCGARCSTSWPRRSSPAYADALTTYGRTLQQRNSLLRAIREEGASRDELRFWDGAFLDAGGGDRRRAPAAARGPGRAAGGGPRRDRPGRGGRRPPDAPLRDQRAATPRGVAAGRARPAARRDGRQGGLERFDADRPAPRRPGLRARRPRPRVVRVARPAADRDPGPQAGRARRRDRARRAPAAAPARRRLLRARSRTAARTSSGASRPCPRRS